MQEPLNKQALQQEWKKLFDKPAPLDGHPSFLEKVISWQKQAAQYGGLKTHEKKTLIGDNPSPSPTLSPGSRLIRVWQGETHQVTVLEKGFLYNQQEWNSLTAIATEISGTRWSGPAFFGIKK